MSLIISGEAFYSAALALSGEATASGNTTLITPASGKYLQLCYVSYNPATAGELAFRFGAAGALIFRNSMPAGGIFAKDLRTAVVNGAVDEALLLNQSAAITSLWNVLYREL